MFIVRGDYEPVEINLEITDTTNPSNSFTLTIDNPVIVGPVVNANAGHFGFFCFTINVSDFPIMDGDYDIVANLITQLRSETCEVESLPSNFSFFGFGQGQGQTECEPIEKIKIEDNILSWDGNADNYTLIIQSDESCCNSSEGPFGEPKEIHLQTNQIDLTGIHKKFGKCVRFKIKSECDDTPWCCAVLDEEKWKLPYEDCLKKEKKPQMVINVFPNPAKNKVSISTEDSKIMTIELFNIYGKPLQTIKNINTVKQDIDVNQLSRGYYIIKIVLEDGSSQFKNVILK